VAAGDLDLLLDELGERVFGRAGLETAVADDLSERDPGVFELARGLGQ
jgi:hypothetical protein